MLAAVRSLRVIKHAVQTTTSQMEKCLRQSSTRSAAARSRNACYPWVSHRIRPILVPSLLPQAKARNLALAPVIPEPTFLRPRGKFHLNVPWHATSTRHPSLGVQASRTSAFHGSLSDRGMELLPRYTPGCPVPAFRRRFRAMPPVRMGRRAAKIATRKTAQDAKKAKQYGKLGKQIVSAVKQGGSNPNTNTMLAAALTFAKQIGAPKDLIDRNIKKATEKGQADFSEIVYEVYGLGGVGIVVEALSDNNARAAATVRDVVKKGGAKMADSGSVLFNFKRCGVLAVPSDSADGDDLLLSAMDAGADDVLEPEPVEEEDGHGQPSVFRVITSPETYAKVRASLEESNIVIDNDLSGQELLPVAFVQPDEEARALNEILMEKLLELDDVDAVYSNQ